MKKMFCVTILLALISVASAKEYLLNFVGNIQKHHVQINKSIGGWSPVFFDQYCESQVNQIVLMANKHKIHQIKIFYPSQQKTLATKIRNEIVKYTKIKPDFYLQNLKDTQTTKYKHDTVVVNLYYEYIN